MINDFGVMRNNKFLVRFHAPLGMKTNAALVDNSKYLEYWCEMTHIPGISVATNEVRRYGYGNIEKKPYVAVNNDVDMTLLSDSDGAIWEFFQQWVRLIANNDMRTGINPTTSNGLLPGQMPFERAYKYEYVSDIEILVFKETSDTPSLVIILREAFPIFLGDIELNWNENNTVAKIPITFSVYDWYNATEFYNSTNNTVITSIDTFQPDAVLVSSTQNLQAVTQSPAP